MMQESEIKKRVKIQFDAETTASTSVVKKYTIPATEKGSSEGKGTITAFVRDETVNVTLENGDKVIVDWEDFKSNASLQSE